nr:aminoacyl-tRNA hydrolase [Kofleriaceae bacterium]
MPTWLVAGLGNPGNKYERNRHNIGFRVVDELARRHALSWKTGGKLGGDVASGNVGRDRAVLVKPMEFMNLSGFAVQRTAAFHGVDPTNVLIVHDELDLEAGIVRLKSGGGHGGHNGLRSIIEQLGDTGFARLRMGIGRDPNAKVGGGRAQPGDNAAASWVLSDFPSGLDLAPFLAAGCDDIEAVVATGITAAMNLHNARKPVL